MSECCNSNGKKYKFGLFSLWAFVWLIWRPFTRIVVRSDRLKNARHLQKRAGSKFTEFVDEISPNFPNKVNAVEIYRFTFLSNSENVNFSVGNSLFLRWCSCWFFVMCVSICLSDKKLTDGFTKGWFHFTALVAVLHEHILRTFTTIARTILRNITFVFGISANNALFTKLHIVYIEEKDKTRHNAISETVFFFSKTFSFAK